MIDEPWLQPTTAPKQPEVADEAIEDHSPAEAGRVHQLPWMEAEPVRPAFTRRITGIDVFTGAVVLAFLFALLVALPLLLLQTL